VKISEKITTFADVWPECAVKLNVACLFSVRIKIAQRPTSCDVAWCAF